MRPTIVALVMAIGVMALPVSGRAAPSAAHDLAITSISPDIVQVAGGCGPGWHPRRWVDRWGRWRVRCVPNRW